MSSPDLTLPPISLRRWLARIALLKSLLLNSSVSLICLSQVFLIQPLFSSRRPSGADDFFSKFFGCKLKPADLVHGEAMAVA
jgi:hypothetical protein